MASGWILNSLGEEDDPRCVLTFVIRRAGRSDRYAQIEIHESDLTRPDDEFVRQFLLPAYLASKVPKHG